MHSRGSSIPISLNLAESEGLSLLCIKVLPRFLVSHPPPPPPPAVTSPPPPPRPLLLPACAPLFSRLGAERGLCHSAILHRTELTSRTPEYSVQTAGKCPPTETPHFLYVGTLGSAPAFYYLCTLLTVTICLWRPITGLCVSIGMGAGAEACCYPWQPAYHSSEEIGYYGMPSPLPPISKLFIYTSIDT